MPGAMADIFRDVARMTGQDPGRKGNVVNLAAGLRSDRGGVARAPGQPGQGSHRLTPTCPTTRTAGWCFGDDPRPAGCPHGPGPQRGRPPAGLPPEDRTPAAAVIFLLGNHDVAQVTGNEISKDGRGVCTSFTESLRLAAGAFSGGPGGGRQRLLSSCRCPWPSDAAAERSSATPCPPPGSHGPGGDEDIPEEPYRPEDLCGAAAASTSGPGAAAHGR